MFQKILKLFGLKKSLTADQILRYPKPRQYSRDEHNIRVADIDPDAVKTLQRIHQMGCRAYIVGGSVRDLLLGRKPKDYDVVTDAHPQKEQALPLLCDQFLSPGFMRVLSRQPHPCRRD